MMSLTALPACSASGKSATSVRTASGLRSNRTVISVTMPSGAFRADDHAAQIRPDLVQRVAAQGHHAAVGAHHREPEDMVGGEAVLQAVRAARVLRHVTPDRADDLARRVGSVVQVVGGHGGGDAEVGHPRLDDRALVLARRRRGSRASGPAR